MPVASCCATVLLVRGRARFELDRCLSGMHRVKQEVMRPRGSRSFRRSLKGRWAGWNQGALLYDVLGRYGMSDMELLASTIKAVPLVAIAPRPIDEAISTAGGVRLEALDDGGMCVALPGVFCAGEMLDWEAPTGGYLLTACMSSGVRVAQGVLDFLKKTI